MSFLKTGLNSIKASIEQTQNESMDLLKKAHKVVGHARDEMIGRWNHTRRHGDPDEQAADELLASIRKGHRYESFAAERAGHAAKWHVDGHDYMWALSEMIDKAREVIFITDWWLTPELYLRRPPAYFPEWRLDRLLQRKAEQGVKIHVIVSKEVTQTMNMSSKHTKAKALHPNITCLRHPEMNSAQSWSHHEKIVVVDNQYAAIGGLDLCFGRWDTHTHPLADVHPTDFSKTLFPGQDYNNARIMSFEKVYDYASNALSILDNARMPWHDVHMTFEGPAVLDISQHFVERWNEIKKRQVDWLALPHEPASEAPNEAAPRHPHYEHWREIGRRYEQVWHGDDATPNAERDQRYSGPRIERTCKVQVVRSVSDWSHGVSTEHSIQDAYIDLIKNAEKYIYIENQFFISATKPGGSVVNQIGAALVERIVRAAEAGEKFRVVVVIPEVPGFAGDIKTESSIKKILAAQYSTINRGGSSIYEAVRVVGFEPLDYIRFYHLRSYDRINAPAVFIKATEEQSAVKFHEAQIALARQWVAGDHLTTQKEVVVVIPQDEAPQLGYNPGKTKTERVPIPVDDNAAREVVEKFEDSAMALKSGADVTDTVARHMLSDRTSLLEEAWLGTEEEELNGYVSEMLYIHSKVMIVDDRRVIIGSANINDRSQKGDEDSEIALVIEDDDMIPSTMNGENFPVSRFAATLRRQLYKEHLGLSPPQPCDSRQPKVTPFMRPAPYPNPDETGTNEDKLVADPISDETEILWTGTAKKNREIFTEIFRPIPTSLVRSWNAYKNYRPRGKTGHVVAGVTLDRVKASLNKVRGTLVDCPLDFLIEERNFT
ncbi:hypothetical protein D9619_004077 [Psilocybe cf. subviscida]|uniref:phospholipase D n=1 Tax=Psilocybe cf. subviscida TaxID=2480587 RepID=A0A8H5F881_9AGAR|nr:hypothetical protein D9619_004077 [Psilocybe cf. subviscida]